MSWGLGWKRPSEIFHLKLNYGSEEDAENPERISSSSSCSSSSSSSSASSTILTQGQELGFRIDLDWSTGDDEDQVALRLQSQLMVALPVPQDAVQVELKYSQEAENVDVDMRVLKRREPLRAVTMAKSAGSGQQNDGVGVLTRLLRSNLAPTIPGAADGVIDFGEHWKTVTMLNLCGCGLTVSVCGNLFYQSACPSASMFIIMAVFNSFSSL